MSPVGAREDKAEEALGLRIMVVAGSSGGHIFPAVSFCQEALSLHPGRIQTLFITPASHQADSLVPSELRPIFLQVDKTPWGLTKLAVVSLRRVLMFRPQIVLGFGGYVSVPFVLLARLLGSQCFIHEQNVLPGRANRFLSRFVHKVAVSFPQTREYLGQCKKKTFLVRYPLRKSLRQVERQKALAFFGLREGLFTVLVLGGSQGARVLNEVLPEALALNRHRHKLQVIHISGPRDSSCLVQRYQQSRIGGKVFAFLKEMHYAYSVADLVVGRSGAGAVHEIMYYGLPSILIPYPYAGAHQSENAKVLARCGAALFLEEDKLNPELLSGLLDIFLDDRIRRRTMSSLARRLYETSGHLRLTDLVFS